MGQKLNEKPTQARLKRRFSEVAQKFSFLGSLSFLDQIKHLVLSTYIIRKKFVRLEKHCHDSFRERIYIAWKKKVISRCIKWVRLQIKKLHPLLDRATSFFIYLESIAYVCRNSNLFELYRAYRSYKVSEYSEIKAVGARVSKKVNFFKPGFCNCS